MKIRDGKQQQIRRKLIHEHPLNAHTHTEQQHSAVRGSLERFGFVGHVLVRPHPDKRRHYECLDGHERLSHFGPEELVPCLVVQMTDEEARAFLAVFDRTTDLAGWDAEKYQELIDGLDFGGDLQELIDSTLESCGLTQGPQPGAAVPDPERGEQRPPDQRGKQLRSKWSVSTGQLWEIKGSATHRLLCGDNSHADNVQRLLDGAVPALVFTSPPYLQQREYEQPVDDWLQMMQGACEHLSICADEQTQVLVNLGLVHRSGEWLPYWDPWLEWMREQGWRRFGFYVWDQGHGLPGHWNGRLGPSHEFVFHLNRESVTPQKWVDKKPESIRLASHGTFRHADGQLRPFTTPEAGLQEHKIPDSVFRVQRQIGSDGHVAQFPPELPACVIRSWPGLVLDPFCGSGSTMLAAEQLQQPCCGLELAPEYVAINLERMAEQGCECRLLGSSRKRKRKAA